MASMKRLLETLESFHEKKILVIGDLMVDRYINGDATRLSSEAPVPIVDVKNEVFKLGGSSNVINNIISLGGQTIPLGIVGRDGNGEWLTDELTEKGMDTSGLIIDPNRPTTTKTRVLVGQHQLIRIDFEERKEIGSKEEDRILEILKSKTDEVDCILLVDYDKGVFTSNLLREISNIAKKKKKLTIASPKRNHFLEYRNIALVKSNMMEAYNAANIGSIDDKPINDVGRRLLGELGCGSLLITRGKDGMALFEKTGDILNIPAFVREVYDVTGAGDVVTAVLALCISSNATVKEASIISNAAAGVKVGKIGTATVNQIELRKQLESFNHIFNNLV